MGHLHRLPPQLGRGRWVAGVAPPVVVLLDAVQVLLAQVALDALFAVRADAPVAADQIAAHAAPAALHLVAVLLGRGAAS